MKKSPFKKSLKILFWLAFAAGCLWLIFVPPAQQPSRHDITVKVARSRVAPLPAQPALSLSGGEEQTAPQAGAPVAAAPQTELILPAEQKPKIALVIDDVGVDLKGSEEAITKLPAAVTLSFLPYAVRLREQAKQARDDGHELLLHMPMEPVGHEDPGPGALFVALPLPDLRQRFDAALASFTGFDGVNNHMGSKFTAYPAGMAMVIDELQQRRLFYLDSRTSAQSVGLTIAREKNLPSIGRDVFLDDDQSPDLIRKQLDETERVARRHGYAVAIGHPHATTLAVLEAWIPEAQKQGFEFVPVHDLVEQ